MSDYYQTPDSNLEPQAAEDTQARIQSGIEGNYHFSISETLQEAWQLISGTKGTIWLAILIFVAINIGLSIVSGIIFLLLSRLVDSDLLQSIYPVFEQIIISLITNPVSIGIFIIGLRRVGGAKNEPGSIMNYFRFMLPLFYTYLLMVVMIMAGLLLFVLPGIYLMVAYTMAMPLVVEKGLGPWQALEASRKAITHHWFGFLLLGIALTGINILFSLPLFIGLIWSIPLTIVAYALIYRNMFGVEPATLHEER